jgi:TonB family protein
MVWETVQEVVDAWGVRPLAQDGSSRILISEWKRFSDFSGSPFLQSVPTLSVGGAQTVPVEFQLHVFVSPFVEPARVHVATVLRTELEQNQYVHHGLAFPANEFFRELEVRLGATGVTIPFDNSNVRNSCLSVSRGPSLPVDLTPVRGLADVEVYYPAVPSDALVILQITIGFDGSVVASRVVSVNGVDDEAELFAQAATNIVSLWRYQPAERDSCPVGVVATVAMSFGRDESGPVFYSRTLAERELISGSESVTKTYTVDDVGLQNPRLLEEMTPQYTHAAQGRQIEGEVWVDAVVMPDGTVGDIKITRSLDMKFGLDVEAVVAAKQWRFEPGTLNGVPVAVQVGIALEFNLN